MVGKCGLIGRVWVGVLRIKGCVDFILWFFGVVDSLSFIFLFFGWFVKRGGLCV